MSTVAISRTPGDRVISWPKLRALLGVSRLSMPDAEAARAATALTATVADVTDPEPAR